MARSDLMGTRRSRGFMAFLLDTRGVSAVEFGLVGPVFLAMALAWIEMGLCLFMSSALDNAARDASRLIRVGSATEASFKTAVCDRASVLMACSGITYKVQAGTSFGVLTAVSSTGSAFSSTGFSGGHSGSDVLVQVGYQKPALIGPFLAPFGYGSTILLTSTLAFQNENY